MKLKFLLASLALVGSLAQASPVTIADSGTVTGSFSNSYSLNVADGHNYLLSLVTQSKQTDITIQSVMLSNGALSYVFDALNDGTTLGVSSWWTTSATSALGVPYSLQHQTYSLSEIFLTSGLWTITVSGKDTDSKTASSYTLSANAVPEPQSLALSLVGLLALGWVARRQRRTGANA